MVDRSVSRRSALKRLGAGTVGLVVPSYTALGSDASLATTEDAKYTWKKQDHNQDDAYAVYTEISHATSVGWYGATYESDDGGLWEHDFRASSATSTRDLGDGAADPRIEYHRLGITQGTTDDLQTSVHDKYHGGWPSPSTDNDGFDHTDWMSIIAKEAVSAVSSKIGYALTGLELAAALIPDNSTSSSVDYAHLDEWEYGTPEADTGHYRWYEAFCGSDESIFDIVTEAGNPSWRLDVRNDFTLHIKSDYTPEEGDERSAYSSTTTSAGTTLFRPNENPEWLVEKIPVSVLPRRAEALGWPQRRLERHLQTSGPVFVAHDAPITLVE